MRGLELIVLGWGRAVSNKREEDSLREKKICV